MRKELLTHWLLLSFSNSVLALLVPLYLSRRGLSESQIGNLFGMGYALSIILLVAGLSYSDNAGRKTFLFLFGLFSAIAAALLISFPFYFAYLIAMILIASSRRSMVVFGKIVSIENFSGEKGKAYGAFSSAQVIGGLAGDLFGGKIADVAGFHFVFGISLLASLLSLLPLLKIKAVKAEERAVGQNHILYFGFLLQRIITMAAFGVAFSFALTLYLSNALSASYTEIGIIAALQGVASMAGLSLGKLADRHGYVKVSIMTIVAASFFIASVYFLTTLWLVVIAILLADFAIGIASTTLPHFFNKVAKKLGRDIALIDAGGGALGSSLGSFLAGFLIVTWGYGSVFLASGLLLLLSIALIYWMFGR